MLKCKKLLLSLVIAVVIFSLPIVASAEGKMSIAIDESGESGSAIEITETTASFPIKIYAGDNGSQFDCFDPSAFKLIQLRTFDLDHDLNNDGVDVTCERIGPADDGYCFVKVSAENLSPGTAYYLFISPYDDWGDLVPLTVGDYSWEMDGFFENYAFCTKGTPNAERIQWGDGYDGANPTVQVILDYDGSLEIASCSSNPITPNCYGPYESIFTQDPDYAALIQTADIRGRVKTIGDYYFAPCCNLKTVTQSDDDIALSLIGNYAFQNCVALRDFYLDSNAEDITIAATAFDGCSNVTIHVGSCGQVKAYQDKFADVANVTFTGPEHTWDDGVVTTEPTVDSEGVKTYTCSVCGETKTEAIAKLDPAAPKMIEGAGQTIEEGKSATFRADIPFADFLKVLADGKEVDKANYDAKEGSTIVTLHADFVKSLGAGKHTIAIVAKDGQAAEATFTVEAEEEVIADTDAPVQVQAQVPATLIMFVLTALGVGIIEIKCRKNGSVIYN